MRNWGRLGMKYEIVKLGELCELVNGYAFKSKDFIEKGFPVIKIKNVKPYRILLDNLSYVDSKTVIGKEQYIIDRGDILLTMTGNRFEGTPDTWVGKSAVFMEKGIYYLNQRLCKIVPKANKINKNYLAYFLSSWDSQLYFIKRATSSGGQANVSSIIIKELEVPVPDMKIQNKIASLLYALDEKIRINDRINNNLQQQSFALFDKLLTKEHLTECCLSQIATINPKRILKKNEPARCIDMAQLSTCGSFPNGWEVKPYNGGMRFSNGDTLFARITPCLENGKTAYIDFLNENEVAFGSTEYIVIASKGEYPSEFFYCLARHPAFVDYAVKNMNGSSGRQRVSAETIGNYMLPVLTSDEIMDFGTTVSCLFKTMRNNSIENMSLTRLRDTLLPKIMSGEIDVSSIQL